MSGRTGPVTFGQLSMIRDLHILGVDGQADANFVDVTAVPGDVTAAEVTTASQQLVVEAALLEIAEVLRRRWRRSTFSPLREIGARPGHEFPRISRG